MKKNKFKIGDRVSVYGGSRKWKGTIIHIGDYLVLVQTEYAPFCEHVWAHFKQCRKLKKKESLTVWVNPILVRNMLLYGFPDPERINTSKVEGWLEFKQVL